MNKLSKATLALAMVSLSAAALAGEPGNNVIVPAGINLIAPDSVGVWSIGGTALLMQQDNNFQYAQVATVTTIAGSPTVTNYSNHQAGNTFSWGGEGDISYMFPGNSRTVSVAYTWLGLSSSDSTSVGTGQTLYGVNSDPAITGPAAASAKANETLNQVDLTFGQLIRIGDRVDLHPFAGARYAGIDTSNKAHYFTTTTSGVNQLTQTYKNDSNLQGAGPRVGIDGAVHLGEGFSIVGTAGASLIVGNLDSKFTTNTITPATGVITGTLQVQNDSYTAVVPELDAKLGINYMYAFNPNTSMNLEVGYQVVNYFNAESTDFINSEEPNSIDQTNNFYYAGPYLRLQVNFA